MSNTTNSFDTKKKNKGTWNPGKIFTVIIISVLALLMVGGLYYILVIIRQNTDDSAIYGYYDKEPIKNEPYNVMNSSLSSDSSYTKAVEDNNSIQMTYSIYSAYQQQVIFQAVCQMAKKAGIVPSQDLVNKLIVDSGVYSSTGSGYDDEIYRGTMAQQRQVIRSFYEKMYPYSLVMADIQTPNLTQTEKDILGEIADETRSFEYFTIDYHIYPENLTLAYDISGMTKEYDEEGNEIQPSLDEIKQYIFNTEPELIKSYIDENIISSASTFAKADFENAADTYASNGINTVENVAVNVAGSSYIYGVSSRDNAGKLNSVYNEDIAKEYHSAELGHVFEPVELPNNEGYLIARVSAVRGDSLNKEEEVVADTEVLETEAVTETESDQIIETTEVADASSSEEEEPSYSSRSLSEFVFELNGDLNIYGDLRSAIVDSDKHEDMALSKIMTLVDYIVQQNNLRNSLTTDTESSETGATEEETANS